MKFVDPKSNIAFKKIFGNDNHQDILISFLNAVLDLQGDRAIADITILDPYQAPKIAGLKETMLDVRAHTQAGVTFIVEMQVEKQVYFDKRALYYASKAYVAQIAKAVDYPKLNQVIFIGILDFAFFDFPHYLSRHLIFETQTKQQTMQDLEFNFIELPKFQKAEHELAGVLEQWVYFIKHAEDLTLIPESLAATPAIVTAFEVAEQHSWTQDELDVYEYWQMEEAGHKDALAAAQSAGRLEGRLEGKEEGKKEKQAEIARKLLAAGVNRDIISQTTGLSQTDIAQLRGECKK